MWLKYASCTHLSVHLICKPRVGSINNVYSIDMYMFMCVYIYWHGMARHGTAYIYMVMCI